MKLLLALTLLVGVAGVAFGAAAETSLGAAEPFSVGAFHAVALRDAAHPVPNDGKIFGLTVGPEAVAEVLRSAGRPTDKIDLSIDALLVRAPGRVYLFDTGLGVPGMSALAASLAAAKTTPDEVTDVLITHSHGDHVGGLVTPDKKRAFPNAKVHMSQAEWAFMQSQPQSKETAAVIAGQVETFEPGRVVVPGVTAVALVGHTPGHTGYEIVSDGARLLDIGDVAHSSVVSLARPEWAMGYDHDKAQGAATRQAELARLAASRELIFAPHFPFPGVGRVVKSGAGYAFVPALN